MLFSSRAQLFNIKVNKTVTNGTAYFCGGMDTSPTYRTATRKYDISNDTVGAGPSIVTGTGSSSTGYNNGKLGMAAFADGTTGILTAGQSAAGSDVVSSSMSNRQIKITISTDATAALSNLAVGWRASLGTTDGIRAVKMGGYYTTAASACVNIIQKYLWSTDAWTTQTPTLANNQMQVGIHANSEFAYRAAGLNEQATNANITYINKWIWASDTLRQVSSVLDEQMGYAVCTGDQSKAVIMAGLNSAGSIISRVKSIIMLTDSRTNQTSLSAGILGNADAAGADNIGIFSFDRGTSGATRKYTYSSDTHAAGTNLITSLNIQGVGAFHSAQIS